MIAQQACPYQSRFFIIDRSIKMFNNRIKLPCLGGQKKFLDLDVLSRINKAVQVNIPTVPNQSFQVGCYG